MKNQEELREAFLTLNPRFASEKVHVLPSIESAVQVIRQLEKSEKLDVLVTGSLHLVGGVMEVVGLGVH